MTRYRNLVLLLALLNCFNCFVVFYLKPPVKYQYMLLVIVWASNFTLFIDPRYFPVTHWVKTRCLYHFASTKHRLYGPDTSTSGFLLLPPEIRIRIWEELTPRLNDTRVSVETYPVWLNVSDIGNAIRHVLRFRPRHKIWLRTRIPLALLKTCRQNYEEGCYFWYTTSTFYFNDP